jgi:hypothetical protein
LRVCFSKQAGTAPNPLSVWNVWESDFERPIFPRSRYGLSKALGQTNHFEDEDDDEYENE